MIAGLSHITLSVSSLDKSFLFYRDVLGFKPLMRKPLSAYFLAGDVWFCIEQDSQTRHEALPEYTHIAFAVSQSDFLPLSERIKTSDARLFKENKSEGDSIYFLDPDGHKLEIHVGTWQSRIAGYRNDPDTTFFV